ncbi:MAG: UDP-N-acetyl-D-mannosamine dehydrogenase, partial [Anaerolineae bacterium]|nr:UDP-N-acetyl-D-mannosamine dehydrogenase [Anaerolineae bacterium]
YRDINIAIANEFSRLADLFNINVWEAISIANLHPRVKILNPGPGVGGHCISVDPWFLVEAAPELTPLIKTARQVNDSQPHFLVRLVERIFDGDVKGRRVALLGLSYKADVDDMRESPAIEAAHALINSGALVSCYDPFYKPEMGLQEINAGSDLGAALADAELILLVVGHSSIKAIKPEDLIKLTPARQVLDVVKAWDKPAWQAQGFVLHLLGDGRSW